MPRETNAAKRERAVSPLPVSMLAAEAALV